MKTAARSPSSSTRTYRLIGTVALLLTLSACGQTGSLLPGTQSGAHTGSQTSTGMMPQDIVITQQPQRAEAKPGERITYIITVENKTANMMEDVRVDDLMVEGQGTILSVSGGLLLGGHAQWTIPILRPGEKKTMNIETELSKTLKDRDIVLNTVSVQPGEDARPVTSTAYLPIMLRPAAAGIPPASPPPPVPAAGSMVTGSQRDMVRVSQQPARSEVQPGDQMPFTVTVQNLFGVPVADLQMEASFLPGQVAIVDPGEGTVTPAFLQWTIPALAAGETKTFRYVVQVNPSLPRGSAVRGTLVVRGKSLSKASVITTDVQIIDHLPATGIDMRFLEPVEDTKQHLTPYNP